MVTVVVADDEARVRQLVRMTLGGADRRLVEVVDGDAALAAICEHRPAVAILDVVMPGLSGLEVCRRVRADPALVGTRVIISSGNATEAEALDAGADAFLPKPFLPSRMRAVAPMVGATRYETAPIGAMLALAVLVWVLVPSWARQARKCRPRDRHPHEDGVRWGHQPSVGRALRGG